MPKRVLQGKVVSDKMQKTVVVAVDTVKRHPFYGKNVKWTKRYMAHDEIGTKAGMIVDIEESKPFSKMVKWNVVRVVSEEEQK